MAPKRRKLNSKDAASSPSAEEPQRKSATDQTTRQDEASTPPAPTQQEYTLPFPDKPEKSIPCIRYSPPSSGGSKNHAATTPIQARLVFTHGAGGGLESAAMQDFSHGFARVAELVCFQGTMHMGNRVKAFAAVVEEERERAQGEEEAAEEIDQVALGGRSMGARTAAMLAATPDYEGLVKALVLVSFPLVSAKGDRREEALLGIPEGVDVLFISGDRDGMCDLDDLREVIGRMKGKTWLVVAKDADHGMGLKGRRDGEGELREMTGHVAARWLETRDQSKRHGSIRWVEEEVKVVEDGWRQ